MLKPLLSHRFMWAVALLLSIVFSSVCVLAEEHYIQANIVNAKDGKRLYGSRLSVIRGFDSLRVRIFFEIIC
jgi:hypothetical protein